MVNFTVSPSCGSYHVSKHPYKIMFQATTRVRNSEDLPHNLSGFNPLNYKDLMSGNLDTDFLVGKYAYVSIFCFLYNYCLSSSNIYFLYFYQMSSVKSWRFLISKLLLSIEKIPQSFLCNFGTKSNAKFGNSSSFLNSFDFGFQNLFL